MGTHPIFESDFDCLTEMDLKKFSSLPSIEVADDESSSAAVLDDIKNL